jgi:hypothetical protein
LQHASSPHHQRAPWQIPYRDVRCCSQAHGSLDVLWRGRRDAATVPVVERRESSERVSKLVATGSRLALDAGTAEVFRSLGLAGVEALLLKGPAIARWLYAEGEPRTYTDCDLLIAPDHVEAAEKVLGSLAYKREFDDRDMPSWWREHATAWGRDDDGLTVDLHRTLPGVGVDAEATWRALSADTDAVVVAGHPVPTLPLPGRALHVALHAAQHGVGWARAMADLERALRAVNEDLWRKAAALAAELEATDAFATGLRLTPAGAQLAIRLQLPASRSVGAVLRAASPPPVALGFEQLARAPGVRARARIVWRKLIPPAGFVRHWDPRAADSRFALLRAYLRRPLWILRHMPRGFRAWHIARRSVRAARRSKQH